MRNPRRESGARSREHDEVRVHAVRLGGRNRFDASSVFSAVASQDGVTKEGASQEEARSPADVGREWIEGETVRGRAEIQTFLERGLWVSARRFKNDEGVLGLLPASTLTGETKQGPWLAGQDRVQPRISISDGKEAIRVCL